MNKIVVKIEYINQDSFMLGCNRELKREGVNEGDIIEGIYNPINKAVDFVSPKTGVDCCAWLGNNCKRATRSYLIQNSLYSNEWYILKNGKTIIPTNINSWNLSKLEVANLDKINQKLHKMNCCSASKAYFVYIG